MPPQKHSKHETEKQRWDRNFADLLQELRVAQTGIQILFAFLLTLPFSNGFPRTTAFQKDVYLVSLLSAAFATAMIIAPVAFHRALFRQGRKPELVRISSRMAGAGLATMLVSVMGAVYLVLEVVAGLGWAGGIVGLLTATYIFLWYVVPRLLK